ncbi:MAG: IMP dehydrogenase [Anaerolineae bacterium]|nr:IMP dehydrogenase [Anaerolineae bacterium]
MKIRSTKGLTFDDVLLVPKRSPVASRKDVHTVTQLTNAISLNIPIISANMDTVTEASMAIAIARVGGIGIIHRFMSIDAQVRQVERVKRAEGFMVENPHAIDQNASIALARRLMQQHEVGGLIVTNGSKKMIGLVTQRDILLAPDEEAPIGSVMTPPDQIISVTPDTSPAEARHLLHHHRLEKLPVIDQTGELVGLITAQDVVKHQRFPFATKDSKGRLRVGAALGVQANDFTRAEALLKAGADLLVLDIAHGHAEHCIDMVKNLRSGYPDSQIVAGNVASRDGARDLAEAGADAIKVGVGPGSICTTRIVTGFGVPQLTAIMDSVAGVADSGRDIPIIADGGIKTSGDLVKALAAGANTVMIGSLFAGCEEAPGATVIRNGQKFKVVRGMASLGAAIGRRSAEKNEGDESAESQEDWDKVVPEGVEAVVPYRGRVDELLYQLVGGLRSGMSYGGATTLAELQANAEFIEITPAGIRESNSHDVDRI